MDHNSSCIWIERLKREQRAKQHWEAKWMSEEEQNDARQKEERAEHAYRNSGQYAGTGARRKISEREAMELRLRDLRAEAEAAHAERAATASESRSSMPSTVYAAAAERIRQQVAASRPRSHRITGDRSFNAMLGDLGPGLWVGVNPAYTHSTKSMLKSSAHQVHSFDPRLGWGAKVDKGYHLKQDAVMAHTKKCLQLGEKPFVSGGMRATPK